MKSRKEESMAQQRPHSRPAATIARKIRRLLIDDEAVIAVAANNRLGRRLILPASGVVVTTHRVLFVHRGIFSMRFRDLHWQHVQDVQYAKSLFGSTLAVVGASTKTPSATIAATGTQRELAMAYLHHKEAQVLYSAAQQAEVEWRERNRQRIVEERRADKSVLLAPSTGEPSTESAPPLPGGPSERLERLNELWRKGLITEDELQSRKSAILGEL
jgi:hypothetical protein